MKILYLANVNLPDDWAHSVQIMKMCEAFSQNGAEVTLVAPYRNLPIKEDIFKFYKINPLFKIVRLPCIDLFVQNPSPVLFWLRYVSFMISARVYTWFLNYDVLYTREIYPTLFFRNVFIELHSLPKKIEGLKKFILKHTKGLIVLTSFIKTKLVESGVSEKKISVAHDAVRIEDFSKNYSKSEARSVLKLSDGDYLVGYIGTFKTMGMEKGISTAISSLSSLSRNYKLYAVGGEPTDIDFYKSYAKEVGVSDRVIFAGKVPHGDIPLHISACDIVTAPFPDFEHYRYYMSPLKIFEYMASKRPIVVSDLPSLKEVLVDGETALFVPTENPTILAKAFERIIGDDTLSTKLSLNAYNEVQNKYTWKKRAENIIKFIQQ